MMKKYLTLPFILLLPLAAHAATLVVHGPPSVGVGESIEVSLLVSSEVSVNTFAGSLTYPADMFDIQTMSDGSSIVGAWVTPPTAAPGTVNFAGVTPGGYVGRGGKLLSIVLRAKAVGSATVGVGDVQVLRNDGAGSKEPTIVEPLAMLVDTKTHGSFVEPTDTSSPEPFIPARGSDAEIFKGKAYVVFGTVDKVSGIESYEVAERRMPWGTLAWAPAQSPYQLIDQNLTSDVYVRALDHASNERIVVVPRVHFVSTTELILGAILLVCGSTFIYVLVRRRFSLH